MWISERQQYRCHGSNHFAGITLVQMMQRDPLLAGSYSVGEMILHALRKGYRNFIIRNRRKRHQRRQHRYVKSSWRTFWMKMMWMQAKADRHGEFPESTFPARIRFKKLIFGGMPMNNPLCIEWFHICLRSAKRCDRKSEKAIR